jgi:hypothetical protein
MSTNRKIYHGRPIIFTLIAFSIASIIMASIINNTNNVNTNLLAFAKKKVKSLSPTSSSDTGGSSGGGSGGGGSTTDHVKIKKPKKPDTSGTPPSDTTTTSPPTDNTPSLTGDGTTGTGTTGVNGGPGSGGTTGGTGGTGGTGTCDPSKTTCPTNPPPPPPCDPPKQVVHGKCILADHPLPLPGIVNPCYPPKQMVDGKCVNPQPPGPICGKGTHLSEDKKTCLSNTTNRPIVVHITVKAQTIRNTVVIRQNTIVHDFTEFTVNPTNNKVVIILPTQNIQDATTKNINMFGTVLNTGLGTARNVGEVRATVFDKDNKTLATLTAVAAQQTLKSQSTITFQLVISPDQVKLSDVKFIQFELVPLRTGSASVASSFSS